MELERLDAALSVCKAARLEDIDLGEDIYFIGRTDEELSVVCRTPAAPANAVAREDGWRAFRIRGTLDFSLVGILARLTAVLAARQIGVFAVSTYNTDYVLVKEERFEEALSALADAGWTVV